MLKQTLLFSRPFYLSVKDRQLKAVPKTTGETILRPIEDIGFILIDNPQINISPPLLEQLTNNNVAVVFCDSTHLPQSMLLNLNGHQTQNEQLRQQLATSEPLKKSLWKQTIECKITNQAALLQKLGKEHTSVQALAKQVKSGDPDNREGTAAREYWKILFENKFIREREGPWPNPALNYGYTILRAAVARALIGSGLLPTLGIHHNNKYNAFCLADDIMEPYRPFVDQVVYKIYQQQPNATKLNKELKTQLLQVLTEDICMSKVTRPLMVGLSFTSASLARCFAGECKHIDYPSIGQMPNTDKQ